MMSLLRNFFYQRPRGFGRFMHPNQYSFNRRRGGMALGGLASLAAPFIIRKLMARRSHAGAY